MGWRHHYTKGKAKIKRYETAELSDMIAIDMTLCRWNFEQKINTMTY